MVVTEDLNNISNDLFTLLLYLSSRLLNPSIMLKGLALPPSHVKVIFHLAKLGPCPVSQIANHLIISRPNMTPIIDKLISEGYVDRYDDPNDRRIIMIKMTEKAHKFLHDVESDAKAQLIEKLKLLEKDDLEKIKVILPQLNDIVQKIK